MWGLSTICVVSDQLPGTGSLESEVPAMVAGAVMNDWAAVLISGRLSSLLVGMSMANLSLSRSCVSGRAVSREVVASEGAEMEILEAV